MLIFLLCRPRPHDSCQLGAFLPPFSVLSSKYIHTQHHTSGVCYSGGVGANFGMVMEDPAWDPAPGRVDVAT